MTEETKATEPEKQEVATAVATEAPAVEAPAAETVDTSSKEDINKQATADATADSVDTSAEAGCSKESTCDAKEGEAKNADSPAAEADSKDAASSQSCATGESNSSDATVSVAIGTQREGETVTEPKAVAAAKANPIGTENQEEAVEVPVGEVRSSVGLEGDVDVNIDDSELGSMMDGADEKTTSEDELEVDSKHKATVARVHNDDLFVTIKGKFDGVVSVRSFKKLPEIGSQIDVIVVRQKDRLYEVRVPGGSVDVGDWDDLVVGSTVEVKISGSNTGGLECTVNNIRGFIPGSHIDIQRVENFGDFVNKKMEVQIQEVNKKKKKLVLSRRALLEKERKEKQGEVIANLEAGVTTEGTVTRLMDFGAFIDIGDVEGLAHVSKLSWDRVNHPKDVLAVGQKVKVKIEKVNKDTGKISLSVKDTVENPWNSIAERFPVDSVVKGSVTRTTDFGAFVKLEPAVEGMVHISEIAHERIPSVKSALNIGDEIDVKVLSIDTKKRRIALSRKATMAAPVKKDDDGKNKKAKTDEKTRDVAVKKTHSVLKGGRDKGSGGEQFGLKW